MSDLVVKRPFDVAEQLRVCGTCFVLFGGEGTNRQLCLCAPSEEQEALSTAAFEAKGTRWHKTAEICRSCGAQLVGASHKFSFWFCPSCKPLADELNRNLGFCAIPVGWHSIVNQVRVTPGSLKSHPGATAVADQLNTFLTASGGVWEWGRAIVERHWRTAGLPLGQDVGIEDYLRAVRARGLDEMQLFEELATARGIPRSCWPQSGPPHFA